MSDPKRILEVGGIICFVLSFSQLIIGFSPSWSLYFGAPEILVQNTSLLFFVCLIIAALLTLFGLYSFSGAGRIRKLPFLKQVLIAISIIYIIRGLLLIPNILVITGKIQTSIHVPPRFVFFSIGSLFIGALFVYGIIRNWKYVSSTNNKKIINQ